MDKTACTIVTGGGRGIGRAIALRMCQETNVIVVSRAKEDLIEACGEIERAGGVAYWVSGDVAVPKTAMETAKLALHKGWKIRSLVCNAGIGKGGPIEGFDPVLWSWIMDVNVHGTFHFIQACLPDMLKNGGGNIILMSSVAGLEGSSHNAAYVASKHAMVGMAKALAKEHGKHGIVTVAVCPGFVESAMTERSISSLASRKHLTATEARERIAQVNPQHRIIPAKEVAEAVAFACSGKVPSLSGSTLVLSGGQ